METRTDKVLDASVIAKWFSEEEGSDRASTYLQNYKDGKFSILIPTLLYYELGNILLSKKATKVQISEIMQTMQALHLIVENIGQDAFRQVFENASDYKITYYDAAYVSLMQKRNCELITADKKLYEKLKKNFSFVKLL